MGLRGPQPTPGAYKAVLTARVSEQQREEFMKLADKEKITVSKLTRLLIAAALKHDAKNAPARG